MYAKKRGREVLTAFIVPDIEKWVKGKELTIKEKFIPRLPLLYVSNEENLFGVQMIDIGDVKIYYCAGSIRANLTTAVCSDEAVVAMPLLIKGHIKQQPLKEKAMELRTGQYSVFHASQLSLVIDAPAQQSIVMLVLLFSAAYYKMHIGLQQAGVTGAFSYIIPGACYMHSGMYDLITRITHAPYSKALHPLYEYIARELAALLLSPFHESIEDAAISKSFYSIKKIIDTNKEKHYSIDELARTAGMNVRQLKEGFKKRFGSGPFAYLKKVRMAYAYDALTGSRKGLKNIAKACGYSNTASFIKAFKKQFGITPGALKKQTLHKPR